MDLVLAQFSATLADAHTVLVLDGTG